MGKIVEFFLILTDFVVSVGRLKLFDWSPKSLDLGVKKITYEKITDAQI